MHGLIITNQEIGHNDYKIKRFYKEFSKRGISLECFKNNGTLANIVDGEISSYIPKETDFILYLDKDKYLARMLEKNGYRLFNKNEFMELCDDKILTYIACSNLGIRMPKTYAAPLCYHKPKTEDITCLEPIAKDLGFPLVLKKVYGSLGEGVYLINNFNELSDCYEKNCMQPLLFQKYIPSSKGKSLRIMVVDETVIGGFVRFNSGDFRSNFGVSADGKKLDNPEKYFSFAGNIAKKLKIEYAGIDLLVDENDDPILCEINSNAFFEEFEKVTGINVAEKVVDLVEKKMKGEKHE